MLTAKNVNSQWSKPKFNSRPFAYKCTNRIGDLLSLLPFFKMNIVVCFTKQSNAVFHLVKLHYLVFILEWY